ncbi:hypothetical protein FOBRF1_016338 [Fusarium oxysporum]
MIDLTACDDNHDEAASLSMATWMAGEWSGAAHKALSDLETTSTTSIMSTAWTQWVHPTTLTTSPNRHHQRGRRLLLRRSLAEAHRAEARQAPRPLGIAPINGDITSTRKQIERWLLSEDGMVSKTEDHGAILVDNACVI